MTLERGRSVTASGGHPLADALTFGDTQIGRIVDGLRVVRVDIVPFEGDRT